MFSETVHITKSNLITTHSFPYTHTHTHTHTLTLTLTLTLTHTQRYTQKMGESFCQNDVLKWL